MKRKVVDKNGNRLKCKECLSKNIYTLEDGTKVCRRCGVRENKKEGK